MLYSGEIPISEPLTFDWVDAFADAPFRGNGCAVVHNAGHLDVETCLAFTRETSLTECTFLEHSDIADIKIRYFVPTTEIPFAGHPTLASVASLVDRGLLAHGTCRIETGAGVLDIDISDETRPLITMTQVAPTFGALVDPSAVAAVGGLTPDDLAAPPQIVSTGLPFCIAVLRSREALERVTLDVAALERFQATQGAGAGVLEPYWVTLEGATDAGNTYARLVLAPPFPPEDAFTGSATGAAAAFLWHYGLIPAPRYVAEQGHSIGRPGQAQVEVLGPPDAITGVRVGGRCHVLMRGTLHL